MDELIPRLNTTVIAALATLGWWLWNKLYNRVESALQRLSQIEREMISRAELQKMLVDLTSERRENYKDTRDVLAQMREMIELAEERRKETAACLARIDETVRRMSVEIGTHETGLRGGVHKCASALAILESRLQMIEQRSGRQR